MPLFALLVSVAKLLSCLPLLLRLAFPLSQIPGPRGSSWNRVWLWSTLASGKADQKLVEVNKKHGM